MTFLCKLVLDVCFSFYTMKLEITFCWLTNLCLKEKKRKEKCQRPSLAFLCGLHTYWGRASPTVPSLQAPWRIPKEGI